jgi:hypothetical protein
MSFEFNASLANDMIGKVMLVGITYINPDGGLQSQAQFFGVVLSANDEQGIKLKLAGQHEGQDYNLPPDTSCIWKADPGVYTLSESKEKLENPDYICTWEVHLKNEQ